MRIQIRTILCPTDFSMTSDQAMRYAVDFAEAYDAELQLVHVVQTSTFAAEDSPKSAVASPQSSEVRLAQLAEQVKKQHAKTTSRIVTGSPFVEISKTAREIKADLIVMGTRSPEAHMELGSVAEVVIRKAPCPVLTVKYSDPAA